MIRMDVLQHVVSQGDKMYLTKQIVAFWGKALRHKALNRNLLSLTTYIYVVPQS